MNKFTKPRPKTELEQLKDAIPNYDKIKLKARIDSNGNIISIETSDVNIKNKLLSMGFTES